MNTQNFFQALARKIVYPFRALYYNLLFTINTPKLATQKAANHPWRGYELTANGILIRIQEN